MTTKKIAGTGILTALTIVLSFLSPMMNFGPVNCNLSLLPIALAGIMFGPLSGLIAGLSNGIIVLTTQASGFFGLTPIAPVGTVLICLLKTSCAGLLSGYIYKWISPKNHLLGVIIASICAPIINTGIFIGGGFIFFGVEFMIGLMVGVAINFAFEFTSTALLAPTIERIVYFFEKKRV